VEYNDLIELARLCLLRGSAAKTPAAAQALRAMAEEYQARAAAQKEKENSETLGGTAGSPAQAVPSSPAQQQQQPQDGSASGDAPPSLPPPKRS